MFTLDAKNASPIRSLYLNTCSSHAAGVRYDVVQNSVASHSTAVAYYRFTEQRVWLMSSHTTHTVDGEIVCFHSGGPRS